ncbi:hypothetical protein RCL1_007296 [Eukaryota sp. TZLM3-RCL]
MHPGIPFNMLDTTSIISYGTVGFIVAVLLTFLFIVLKNGINMDLLANVSVLSFITFVVSLGVSLGTLFSFWLQSSIFTCFKLLAISLPIVAVSGVRSFRG